VKSYPCLFEYKGLFLFIYLYNFIQAPVTNRQNLISFKDNCFIYVYLERMVNKFLLVTTQGHMMLVNGFVTMVTV